MEAGLSDGLVLASGAAESSGYLEARRHLERARDELFAVHADPSGAYGDVIRAVEAVACPMFLPRDALPTLGKVRHHLQDAGAKYEYVLTDESGTRGTTAGVVACSLICGRGTATGTRADRARPRSPRRRPRQR